MKILFYKKQMTQKSQVWGSRLKSAPDQLNIEFCAGRDVSVIPMAEDSLLIFDIWTNMAHSKMLEKQSIISPTELDEIRNALIRLEKEFIEGSFILDPEKEDVHTNIEAYITDICKVEAGKKIHTGRSRNDQVATDMRLFLRSQVLELIEQVSVLISSILEVAQKEMQSLMPGFTHHQPAMFTTMGHWLTAWSQGLIRDCERLLQDLHLLNRCPLGAAASFGTSWPIDREYTAKLLGFSGVEENTLDCISSRGENEARLGATLSVFMNHLSTISQDIILLSTPYYGMITLDDRFVTGSSIMPQKRNPDFAEVIKSKASMCHGMLSSLLGIQKGAMSGYNRDTQQTKYLVMDLFRECFNAPLVLSGVIESMNVEREVMYQKCEQGFMNSADVADWLARQFHLSFRNCYGLLSLAVKFSEKEGILTLEAMQRAIKETGLVIDVEQSTITFLNSPSAMLDKKQHIGAPSPYSVEQMIKGQKMIVAGIITEVNQISKRSTEAKKLSYAK
ncbi:MAG: argininosuccinate lyase [Proteobacteria bacterium]|nr:argininosuccinate lyase [Pseudomonadota bacterium]